MSSPSPPDTSVQPAKAASSFDDIVSNENHHIEQIEKVSANESASLSHDADNELHIDNILKDFTPDEVMAKGRAYALSYGMDPELFARGALVARSPKEFQKMLHILKDDELEALEFESTHKWRAVPKSLYSVIIMCSVAAAVQGMDESVTNGANLFWPYALGIGADTSRNTWLLGLCNSAPYLCCSMVSCWLTGPLNEKFGRKGTIFITCFISWWTCFWQGFVDSWYHLFVARFFMGFGIGPKSATVPIYAAETTPANIRGALVMMWQMWTAFGIMLGTVFSLAFFYVDNSAGLSHAEFAERSDHIVSKGLNWRLMLGSAMLPAIYVCFQVLWCPESPRWLMGQNRHKEAYEAYETLRIHPILAARDTFYQYVLFIEETSITEKVSYPQRMRELFTIRRNLNAVVASCICFFMQQFCGINESGFSTINSLIASWGFGMVNTVFALPAVFTIDTFGRKTLLMLTFPLMSIFLLLTGFAFWIPESNKHAHVGVIAFGIYIYSAIYSIGEGPVPFTYGAEVHELKYRSEGMSLGVATTWFFNFVLAITWPSLLKAFKPQGAFGWYAAWNFIGFFLVLFFMRETKGYTLEELDYVFDVPMHEFTSHEVRSYWRRFEIHVLRRKLPKLPPLHATHIAAPHELDEKAIGKHIDRAASEDSH